MRFSRSLIIVACCWALTSTTRAALVTQTLKITWETGAPDGQSREMIFVNGQFPGPALIFNEDDDVEITVQNEMPQNTTVHWHGISQIGTPWSDGTPGLTQQPINPGESFVYRFKATPVGTYWYHSHDRMSLLDGLYGALFIRPKPTTPLPLSMISDDSGDISAMAATAHDPHLIILSDWDRYTSDQYWAATLAAQASLFCVDSILVNGKGSVYCPSQQLLIDETSPAIKEQLGNLTVNDKGCFGFTPAFEEIWVDEAKPNMIPPNLQSGCIPSTGENETIEVDPADKWVSLNFISAATFKIAEISIDNHDMWVYEMDGQYVEPMKVQVFSLWGGERVSVMVKLDKPPGAYTIRVPDVGGSQIISGYATLLYKGAQPIPPTTPYVNYGGEVLSNETIDYVDYNVLTDNLPPYPNVRPAATADEEYLLLAGRFNSSIDYTMTGKAMYPMDNDAYHPLLYYPNDTAAMNPDLVIRTKNGSWVDLILQVSTLPGDSTPFVHVMHKHGSKTWRIGQSIGVWNYSSVAEAMQETPESFDLQTANYRDTWLTAFPGPYWVVLRYQVTNPGAWFFHCHIEIHLAGGMGMVIMEGVDAWPTIPEEYALVH